MAGGTFSFPFFISRVEDLPIEGETEAFPVMRTDPPKLLLMLPLPTLKAEDFPATKAVMKRIAVVEYFMIEY